MFERETPSRKWVVEIDISIDVVIGSLSQRCTECTDHLVDVKKSPARTELCEIDHMLLYLQRFLLRLQRSPPEHHNARARFIVDEKPETLLTNEARGAEKED